MAIHFSSCRIILCISLVFLSIKGLNSRRITNHREEDHHIDPSVNVFFTINDLKIGKQIPIYFPNKNKTNTPHLLTRQQTKSIPFSSKNLPYLLKLFSFPKNTPQAKAIEYTLNQCETDPKIEKETKLCVTSLESMLDYVRGAFGLDTEFRALSTNYGKEVKELQKYRIVEVMEKRMRMKMMISCHVMPYPYVVYYCHSRSGSGSGNNRVFEVVLRGEEDGEKVEAVGICHMDTSKWDVNHVSFRLLNVKPGLSSVCHFLPADNLVWVPY
ncbi:BURP domain protein USPL1-like [Euphorbia lathyris]|uniref:BURP domain protein USPL1-like n=1 Tax=Euphorbia lathyris TaxID=212925 RepID=UPI0033138501